MLQISSPKDDFFCNFRPFIYVDATGTLLSYQISWGMSKQIPKRTPKRLPTDVETDIETDIETELRNGRQIHSPR